mmetsp:Transcript_11696/g.38881  ORF Transcript_11696/g.38881 Transcript_11696/m.38881 type:complete len:204 (-) Transcript_11696:1390-2001(-)
MSFPSTPFGSYSFRNLRKLSVSYRLSMVFLAFSRSSVSSGNSIFAQCVFIPYRSPSASVSRAAYFLNAFVMAFLWVSSSLGRYMIIPIQECKPRLPLRPVTSALLASAILQFVAGDIGERDPALQRCSIGAGAGIPSCSMICNSSVMYCKSAPVFDPKESPVLNATSNTCCWPPQSNPRIWSLQSHRVPQLRRQNSPSAAFTS